MLPKMDSFLICLRRGLGEGTHCVLKWGGNVILTAWRGSRNGRLQSQRQTSAFCLCGDSVHLPLPVVTKKLLWVGSFMLSRAQSSDAQEWGPLLDGATESIESCPGTSKLANSWDMLIGPNLQLIHVLFFFLTAPSTCEILVPQPGTEPGPPALEAWSLNHWTTKEIPRVLSK